MTERDEIGIDLYIAGEDPRIDAFIATIRSTLSDHGHPETCLRIIDLVDEPDRAIDADILAIPTLIRHRPEPPRRVIGNVTSATTLWELLFEKPSEANGAVQQS